jgi:hypothetical protein
MVYQAKIEQRGGAKKSACRLCLLGFYLVHSLTLKIETIHSSETSVNLCPTTGHIVRSLKNIIFIMNSVRTSSPKFLA